RSSALVKRMVPGAPLVRHRLCIRGLGEAKEVHLMYKLFSVLVILVVLASGCTTLKGKTAGESVDDTKITSQVKAKLAADKVATRPGVSVSTNKGSVGRTGNVDKAEERPRAEEPARSVDGVREVVNNIKPASGG